MFLVVLGVSSCCVVCLDHNITFLTIVFFLSIHFSVLNTRIVTITESKSPYTIYVTK
jgi:hypothetical protein